MKSTIYWGFSFDFRCSEINQSFNFPLILINIIFPWTIVTLIIKIQICGQNCIIVPPYTYFSIRLYKNTPFQCFLNVALDKLFHLLLNKYLYNMPSIAIRSNTSANCFKNLLIKNYWSFTQVFSNKFYGYNFSTFRCAPRSDLLVFLPPTCSVPVLTQSGSKTHSLEKARLAWNHLTSETPCCMILYP